MSQLGRARYTAGWPAATSMKLAGMSSHVASDTTRVRVPMMSWAGHMFVPSLCFHIFGPGFQVVTRVINEGGGDVAGRGGHCHEWDVGGWVDGWVLRF
jgi:hypothetical protein